MELSRFLNSSAPSQSPHSRSHWELALKKHLSRGFCPGETQFVFHLRSILLESLFVENSLFYGWLAPQMILPLKWKYFTYLLEIAYIDPAVHLNVYPSWIFHAACNITYAFWYLDTITSLKLSICYLTFSLSQWCYARNHRKPQTHNKHLLLMHVVKYARRCDWASDLSWTCLYMWRMAGCICLRMML